MDNYLLFEVFVGGTRSSLQLVENYLLFEEFVGGTRSSLRLVDNYLDCYRCS